MPGAVPQAHWCNGQQSRTSRVRLPLHTANMCRSGRGEVCALDAYTDLTVARPILPLGLVPPALRVVTPDGWPLHGGGRLA